MNGSPVVSCSTVHLFSRQFTMAEASVRTGEGGRTACRNAGGFWFLVSADGVGTI